MTEVKLNWRIHLLSLGRFCRGKIRRSTEAKDFSHWIFLDKSSSLNLRNLLPCEDLVCLVHNLAFQRGWKVPEKGELMRPEMLRKVALSDEADKCWKLHPQQHRKLLPHIILGFHLNPDKSPSMTAWREGKKIFRVVECSISLRLTLFLPLPWKMTNGIILISFLPSSPSPVPRKTKPMGLCVKQIKEGGHFTQFLSEQHY